MPGRFCCRTEGRGGGLYSELDGGAVAVESGLSTLVDESVVGLKSERRVRDLFIFLFEILPWSGNGQGQRRQRLPSLSLLVKVHLLPIKLVHVRRSRVGSPSAALQRKKRAMQ